MAKAKPEKEEVVTADAVEEVAEESKKSSKTSATVTWRGGVRTYTKELHGDAFLALAKEFAEKKGGTVA